MHKQTKIYFRADGSSKIGLGHVIRSLALAEILRESFEIHFIIKAPDQVLTAQIHQVCHKVILLRNGLSFENEAPYLIKNIIQPNSILVLDGYQFDTDYQRVLKKDTIRMICIDDIFKYHFLADAIINHAGGITKSMYSAEANTKFFLGPRFALLRKSFQNPDTLDHQEAAIFICLGGADPNNDIIKIVERLDRLKIKQKLYVVIGSAYRDLKKLKESMLLLSLDYKILKHLSAEQMAAYMSKCPVAITTPSSVAYEYLSFGGALYVVQIADNQQYIFQYLTLEGLAFSYENFPETDPEILQKVLDQQKVVFDGKAGSRLYKIFRDLDNDLNCRLRKVTQEDLPTIFQWANDPSVREQSFNPNPISLDEHQNWFSRQMDDPACFFYLLEYQNEPVGQLRFNINQASAIISYTIAKDSRGKGFGKLILEKGIQAFKKEYNKPVQIAAYVKKRNFASVHTFAKLKFEKQETQDYEDSYLFILNQD